MADGEVGVAPSRKEQQSALCSGLFFFSVELPPRCALFERETAHVFGDAFMGRREKVGQGSDGFGIVHDCSQRR
jgi:hypothetical protein